MNRPVLELRVAITTSDFERLTRFYCDGLGLEPAQLWTRDGGRALLIEMGKATLEIFDEARGEGRSHRSGRCASGPIRFALEVPDLQAAMGRLLSKSARLVHPPVVTPWGRRNARLEDPDGMQLTLFQTGAT